MGVQLVAVGAVITCTFVATRGALWATDRTVGPRIPEADEEMGLDDAEHGEVAYHDVEAPLAPPPPHAGDASLVLGVMKKRRSYLSR